MTEQVKHTLKEIFETLVLMFIVWLLVFIWSRIINIEINENNTIQLNQERNAMLQEMNMNIKIFTNK